MHSTPPMHLFANAEKSHTQMQTHENHQGSKFTLIPSIVSAVHSILISTWPFHCVCLFKKFHIILKLFKSPESAARTLLHLACRQHTKKHKHHSLLQKLSHCSVCNISPLMAFPHGCVISNIMNYALSTAKILCFPNVSYTYIYINCQYTLEPSCATNLWWHIPLSQLCRGI